MKNVLLVIFGLVLCSCVKVQVKPEKIVSDTVRAGKDIYDTVQRNREGKQERVLSHRVAVQNGDTASALTSCRKIVKQLAAQENEDSDMEILKESTEIVDEGSRSFASCEMVVLI